MPPVVVEVAPIRCPELDAKLKETMRYRVPRPKPPLGKNDVRAWLDRHEIEEERKIAAGEIIIREHETCRNPKTPNS